MDFNKDVVRFHSHINKLGDCWLWTKAKDKDGYGFFKVNRKMIKAHRYMWQLLHGPITSDVLVCHTCDNPTCVKPEHLFIGTHQDNVNDQKSKGRTLPGSKNPAAKLTVDDVKEIRFLVHSGWTQTAISEAYGVSQVQIGKVINEQCWHGV
jgi:hypothetical protein